jgi:hypothetical protein
VTDPPSFVDANAQACVSALLTTQGLSFATNALGSGRLWRFEFASDERAIGNLPIIATTGGALFTVGLPIRRLDSFDWRLDLLRFLEDLDVPMVHAVPHRGKESVIDDAFFWLRAEVPMDLGQSMPIAPAAIFQAISVVIIAGRKLLGEHRDRFQRSVPDWINVASTAMPSAPGFAPTSSIRPPE